MNRTEVLAALQPLTELASKRIDHTPSTKVMIADRGVVLKPGNGSHHLEISKNGAKSLMDYIGLPIGTAEALKPDTFSRVATELLEAHKSFQVITKQGEVIQFGKPVKDAISVHPEKVLKVAEKALGNIDYYRVCMPRVDTGMIELLGDKEEAVAKGDLIKAGVFLEFSPIGTIKPMVQSYAMRLACTNGATSNSVLREFTFTGGEGGEGDGIWQWYRKSIKEAYRGFSKIVTSYQKMISEGVKPEDRAQMLEAMLKAAGIKGMFAEAVRARALETPPQNAFDMHNLITWASSHLLTEPAQIRRALTAGAHFSDETAHRTACPVCHRSN